MTTKVMVIFVLIGAPETVLKDLVRSLEESEIGERVETIQTTALLRSAKKGRLKRYRQRVKQYRQNRTFQNNERKF